MIRQETRPWGRFEVLYEDETQWLKRIIIAPGQSLSLQRHTYREEHWLAEGTLGASYMVGINMGRLWPGEIVTVRPLVQHRLWNPCDVEVSVLEWALGQPDEADIQRLEDNYGR